MIMMPINTLTVRHFTCMRATLVHCQKYIRFIQIKISILQNNGHLQKELLQEIYNGILKNVIIGSVRNWSKVALEWNLANDASFQPHTPGGCTECKGALTISGSSITRNVSYYIIGHASKFVPMGSKRIQSITNSNLPNVAFMTPAGKKVMIIENDKSTNVDINVKQSDKLATVSLPAGAVAT
eukprot:Opistho-2@14542